MASTRPQVVIQARVNQYSALASLAYQVVADMTLNIASFPTPNPALTVITGYATAVTDAIATWGPVGNRGSHADLLALRSACSTLRAALVLEAAYVQNLVPVSESYPDQAAFIALSGFAVKNSPTPQGLLGPAQNFHQLFQNSVSVFTPKLKWKKPLGLTSPNNVKSYVVERITGVDPTTKVQFSTTRTSLIDTTVTPGLTYTYVLYAVNTNGTGAGTGGLTITVPNV